jgi:hypothetical protein
MAASHAETGMPIRSHHRSRGATFVAMMQTTDLREGDSLTCSGRLNAARLRTILVEREMGSGPMMIM